VEGYSSDCVVEDGSIIIAATSVDSSNHPEAPPPPKGFLAQRVQVRDFHMNLKLISTSKSRIVLTYVFDPMVHGPVVDKALNFVVKNSAGKDDGGCLEVCSWTDRLGFFLFVGSLLHFLHEQAKKILRAFDTNPIARKIREQSFYNEFLASRIVWYSRVIMGEEPPAIIDKLNINVRNEGMWGKELKRDFYPLCGSGNPHLSLLLVALIVDQNCKIRTLSTTSVPNNIKS